VKTVIKVHEDEFDAKACDFDMYKRCYAFITTRCFGYGLPTTIVAPVIDMLNHAYLTQTSIEIINKRLHLSQN